MRHCRIEAIKLGAPRTRKGNSHSAPSPARAEGAQRSTQHVIAHTATYLVLCDVLLSWRRSLSTARQLLWASPTSRSSSAPSA